MQVLHQFNFAQFQFMVDQCQSLLHQQIQIIQFALTGHLAREGQQIAHQFAATAAFAFYRAQILDDLGTYRRVARHLVQLFHREPRVSQDSSERIVDFVSDRGGELTERRHLFAQHE